jgi:hypothetical protein
LGLSGGSNPSLRKLHMALRCSGPKSNVGLDYY